MTARTGSPYQVAVTPSDSTEAPRNAIVPFTAARLRWSPGTSIRLSSRAILPATVIDWPSPPRGIASSSSMVLSPCIAKWSIAGVNRARRGLSARKRTTLALAPSMRASTCATGTSASRSSMVTLASRTSDPRMRPDPRRTSSRRPSNPTTADRSVASGQSRA